VVELVVHHVHLLRPRNQALLHKLPALQIHRGSVASQTVKRQECGVGATGSRNVP
jgi:hypothetical protein